MDDSFYTAYLGKFVTVIIYSDKTLLVICCIGLPGMLVSDTIEKIADMKSVLLTGAFGLIFDSALFMNLFF